MILVRMVFQTKWGKVQESVDWFKENREAMKRMLGPQVRVRILTDLSGPFHTMVQEMEFESLAAWEKARTAMFSSPEMADTPSSDENPFESGRAEFYTIEADF